MPPAQLVSLVEVAVGGAAWISAAKSLVGVMSPFRPIQSSEITRLAPLPPHLIMSRAAAPAPNASLNAVSISARVRLSADVTLKERLNGRSVERVDQRHRLGKILVGIGAGVGGLVVLVAGAVLRPFVKLEARLRARHRDRELVAHRLRKIDAGVARLRAAATDRRAAVAVAGEDRLVVEVVGPEAMQRKMRGVEAVRRLRRALRLPLPGGGFAEGRLPACRKNELDAVGLKP